ncbi:restriction endonuclease subunit S [Schinkia azotoformans]|uniref:restriction endonuclease subunit S n=1 Tax=Schinkia azotoformans TaxID=1454 RepID=UPI002E1BC067|nr:restriction endonuclease subunit S [Schinkia azotoformans]MED4351722.1 restriction endonuclease subunit S [Schinkia azotoformans]
MSKTVKKQKSIELMLEEVLVPEDEQLYEIPGNWVWTNLNSISKLVVDGSHNPPTKQNEGFPMLSGRNILDGEINFDTDRYVSEEDYQKEYKRTPIQSDDVLLTIVGTIGRTTVVPKGFSPFVLQRSVALIKPMINSNYLSYYFSSPEFQSYLQRNAKGTAQKGIYLQTLKKSSVPLPSLNEQKRIAVKVERLLNKIEEAKQLVEEAKETFELRRVAFVNTLFKESSNKQIVNISDIADVKGGKRLPKGETLVNENTGFPYIKAGDLKNGTVLIDKLQFLLPSTQEKIKNYIVNAGDVYITIVGACIGDVGVIPQEVDGANLTENAAKLTNLQGCLPEFLALWLSSNKAQNLIKESIASATLGKLSLTRIKSLSIPLYDLESQLKIVDKYLNFTKKENEIAKNLDKIDLDILKQSILSKAFRGELGTNDLSEENAIELLKEVLQEQVK